MKLRTKPERRNGVASIDEEAAPVNEQRLECSAGGFPKSVSGGKVDLGKFQRGGLAPCGYGPSIADDQTHICNLSPLLLTHLSSPCAPLASVLTTSHAGLLQAILDDQPPTSSPPPPPPTNLYLRSSAVAAQTLGRSNRPQTHPQFVEFAAEGIDGALSRELEPHADGDVRRVRHRPALPSAEECARRVPLAAPVLA
ncbi:hypothetical protein A0H81_01711 [Grifola frondosa]|uniref:Uncharacterized protein n=1 Tax=Grifola frondosa TaxID=5627 RepID=A0A1C7MMR7_GRIFR|nr:hypothetical protein A0H81_01711 [Grifola frondosa]